MPAMSIQARKPKARVARKPTLRVPKARGFSLSNPFTGKPFISANWKQQAKPRARASRGLAVARTYRNASSFMSRNMRYGQSFNTGAVSMGMDDGVVHVKHREFLGVINSSTAFTTQTYDLNPGLSRLCPWGSAIANNFQQYKINDMAFEFISTSATALSTGTNNALGQISIATQYDSISPEFRNLNDMLNSQWATSTKISSDLLHPIEAEKAQTTALPLYIRSGRAPGDIRLYDWGRTTLAVYGCQSTGDQIGQIWVSYDVCFYKPITYNLDGGNAESAFITCQRADPPLGGVDFGTQTPLGGRNFANYDNIGVVLNQSDGIVSRQSITLPSGSSGYYQMVFAYYSNSTTWVNTSPFAGTFSVANGSVQTSFFNLGTTGIAGQTPPVPTPVEVNSAYVWIINVVDPSLPCVLSFNADWGMGPYIGDRGAVLNISLTQLNVGLDNFQLTPSASDCCQDIRLLIDRVNQLELELKEHEQESDDESEHSHERDGLEEQLLELVPPLPDPDVEAKRQALLAQLHALDAPVLH